MTAARTLDVSGLPPYKVSNESLLFWGQVLMCCIEGTLLLMLGATYFYLRLSVDVWPPPGIPSPSVSLPSLALIPLVASCIGSYLASEGAKEDNRSKMLLGMAANLILGLIFLLIRGWAWKGIGFTWNSDAYGSIFWAILFLHTYDIVADLLMTVVLIIIVASGKHGPKQRIGVHVDSVLWYFLVGIWIPLYGILYWAPRWIGTGR